MGYLLYLRRSLVRRPGRHVTLYVILTCAFILPLLISIYRDSSAWGEGQQALELTRGAAFHIENAGEADLELFRGIAGLDEPELEDGVIYLRFLSEEDWRDGGTVDRCGGVILDRIRESGRTYLLARAYRYGYEIGSDGGGGQTALLALNVFVMLLSSLTVGSAYRSHLRRFDTDIGVLRSLGAGRGQIFAIFITEFLAVFALAAGSALLLAAGVMKMLFAAWLEVRDRGFAWLIFRMDPANTALHIGIFFLLLLALVSATLVRASTDPAAGRSDAGDGQLTMLLPELIEKAG